MSHYDYSAKIANAQTALCGVAEEAVALRMDIESGPDLWYHSGRPITAVTGRQSIIQPSLLQWTCSTQFVAQTLEGSQKGSEMGIDPENYPHLFQERVWPFGPTHAVFELGTEPPAELIGQVTMVPYIGDEWLLLRHRDGYWFPGGHLEPGETCVQTIHREMREEAGARLVSYVPFGAWRCRSLASKPHRPHVPYPLSYWAVGYGEVKLVEKPEERVLEVVTLPLEEACCRLCQTAEIGPMLVELYRLAAALRAIAACKRSQRCDGGGERR